MTQIQPQELDKETQKQQSPPKNGGKQLYKKDRQVDKPHNKHRPKPLLLLGVIALLAGLGYGVYRIFFSHPDPGLFLSGRIEGHETDVSAKIGGRIANVAVREGDIVKPGQLLVQIDDADQLAQVRGSEAKVRSAQESLKRYRQQLPVLEAQLEQANLTTQQAKQDSLGKVKQAQNSLAVSRAQLVQAQANLTLAQVKQQRYKSLAAQGAVAVQTQDEYDTSAQTAQATVNAARQQVQSAEGTLIQAQATLRNQPIKAAAALQIEKQIVQARTDIAKQEADLQDAQATLAQSKANLNYLTINSPLTGSVITRSVEPGEVIAAGAPLLTIVNTNYLYLRGFIPEGDIGRVKVGYQGLVYLDAFPKQPLQATVTRVDPKASFTPENTYFKKDRVTQVFGVELTLKNNQGLAKPGIPADGRILESGVRSQE
ncbi:HlyD family efflux transporter periplasmic adaptor subunit [Aetokthonos hydrillicola Thurmond2011]|jgi:HlyD family secretion protein|uniref:HlyD family efflux transporter periplasmic adaptor subunit n=2 Tax=Aetokthonos TaxID=1550243 RepID=A0AAP5I0T1_9CYAN|nr:HlyD family efflux transporter periplasmic adaptor subunit [Aetokthonos hydrillicola]MBO3460489.1 HlyD family efflux transporter periplasmic adaptor subunit [Aetokthonos hydrillicola CCALA 1050]MBW4588223.1 HlyD family efflux transporter periplasmic adaptor subunit [Aetokthonos hydrillicola CCALA 1050]MDR9893093.1 HlyD family efflux transporter periplasmic adaptor subunit [Aetokthonos hydrillicola Thurmond2011]